jgi:hypothetical protein
MSENDSRAQERRLRLAANVIAHLGGLRVDRLQMALTRAYLLSQTPQEAAVDAASHIDQCDPISEPGPADTGKEV